MSESRPDPVFFLANSSGIPLLINLYQIVMVSGLADDRITLHLSNGEAHAFIGEQAVSDILGLLEQFSIAPDGEPLLKALAKHLPRIQLVKPKPTNHSE